jgi:hypothetical protein
MIRPTHVCAAGLFSKSRRRDGWLLPLPLFKSISLISRPKTITRFSMSACPPLLKIQRLKRELEQPMFAILFLCSIQSLISLKCERRSQMTALPGFGLKSSEIESDVCLVTSARSIYLASSFQSLVSETDVCGVRLCSNIHISGFNTTTVAHILSCCRSQNIVVLLDVCLVASARSTSFISSAQKKDNDTHVCGVRLCSNIYISGFKITATPTNSFINYGSQNRGTTRLCLRCLLLSKSWS